MISCEEFANLCKKNDLTFFSGVPDSTFKSWMSFLNDAKNSFKNIIAVNECEAIAVASGYHLSTGKIGVVYMQNSGFGKTVNPITSLADPDVYGIPMILMIGWRGEPGKKDEPQHKKMGRIMMHLLKTLEISYEIMSDNPKVIEKQLEEATNFAKKNGSPYALIIRTDTFADYSCDKKDSNFEMKREEAIIEIVKNLDKDDIIISTTGKTSRELFECREHNKQNHSNDFYTVGSMGCSSGIAFSVALQKKNKVFVFDGDGAALMQMGSFATIGYYKPKNLYHILFDNSSYESTGGQPTVSDTVDFEKIAKACGYNYTATVKTKEELNNQIKKIKNMEGPLLIVVKIKCGSRKDLGRPTIGPIANKKSFMEKLDQHG